MLANIRIFTSVKEAHRFRLAEVGRRLYHRDCIRLGVTPENRGRLPVSTGDDRICRAQVRGENIAVPEGPAKAEAGGEYGWQP